MLSSPTSGPPLDPAHRSTVLPGLGERHAASGPLDQMDD